MKNFIFLLLCLFALDTPVELLAYKLLQKQSGIPNWTAAYYQTHPILGNKREDYAYWPPAYPYWIVRSIPVYLSGLNLVNPSIYEPSIRSACNTWNNALTNQKISLSYQGIDAGGNFGNDSKNMIYWITDETDPLYTDLGFGTEINALALTYLDVNSDNTIDEFDIAFNGVGKTWVTYPEDSLLGIFDFQAQLTHELGHGLGLGHSEKGSTNDPNSPTMFATYFHSYMRTLELDDKSGLGYLYPNIDNVVNPLTGTGAFILAMIHAKNDLLSGTTYLMQVSSSSTIHITPGDLISHALSDLKLIIPSNVRITSSATISFDYGANLEIEPGATISFPANTGLTVSGSLTISNAALTSTGTDQWWGISAYGPATSITDTYIKNATEGLFINNSGSNFIKNCTFEKCYWGVYASNASETNQIEVKNSTFKYNTVGLYVANANVLMHYAEDPVSPNNLEPDWPVPLTGNGCVFNNVYGIWINNGVVYLDHERVESNGTQYQPSAGILVEGETGQLYCSVSSTSASGSNNIGNNGQDKFIAGRDIVVQNGGYAQIGRRISYVCGYSDPEDCYYKLTPEAQELMQLAPDPNIGCTPIYCTADVGTGNYISHRSTGYRIMNFVTNKTAYAHFVNWQECPVNSSYLYGSVSTLYPFCNSSSSAAVMENNTPMSVQVGVDSSKEVMWMRTLMHLIVNSTIVPAVHDSVLQAFNELSLLYPVNSNRVSVSWGRFLNYVETHALSPKLRKAAKFYRLTSHVTNKRWKTVYVLADSMLHGTTDDNVWLYCQQQKISSLLAQHRFQESENLFTSIKSRSYQIDSLATGSISAFITMSENSPNPNSMDSVAYNKEATDYYPDETGVKEFTLNQNYPNPFNPTTTISYKLPADKYVSLKVFNALGEEVATLINEFQTAGYKSVVFDGKNLSSGVYFFHLYAGTFNETKKMLLLK